MSALPSKSIYQPVGREVLFDGQKYCVFDIQLSSERANFYLNEAKQLAAQSNIDADMEETISERLLVATDFGSSEAPYILAMRILEGKTGDGYDGIDAVVLLGIAADRGHKAASLHLASCYSGNPTLPALLEKAHAYFAQIEPEERQILNQYYSSSQ